MPKISYVVPVYNAEKTVRRCVESLVYGEEKDIEVLLSEDCSKDRSWELCKELAEQFKQVRCIRNDHNSGVSRTRNHALDEATGEYILFVDSDDWVCAEYAAELLRTAEEYPQDLVLCGYRFFDQTINYRYDYLWDTNGNELTIVEKQAFFRLQTKVLLQALWNKVFRRDIIEKQHIRFDESQSMGEDLEFVLSYMKASSCERCVVINKPLYSYIRANQTSLMSGFGLTDDDGKYRRMEMLRDIAGKDDPVVRQQYEAAVLGMRNEYIRRVMRSSGTTDAQKKAIIEKTVGAERASEIYRQQCRLIKKEKTVKRIDEFKAVVKWKMACRKRKKRDRFVEKQRKKLTNPSVTILAQNCIAGLFYHDMGLPFQSPTINLFLDASDFVKLAQNPTRYFDAELQMKWGIDYPIGTLEDITVNFMHYETCEEARSAWERRKERINYDRILVLCTDRGSFTEDVFEQWKAIPYPKVLFTAKAQYAKEAGSVYYPEYESAGCVPDLIPKREFYKDDVLVTAVNRIGNKP